MRLWLSQNLSGSAGQRATVRSEQSLETDETCRDKGSGRITASAINSAQIIASAIYPDCLEYRIAGICYWLFCTQFGCTVRTSVKVKHYNAMDPLKHVGVIELALFSSVLPGPGTMLQNMQVRTRDLETTTDEAQSPSPGNKGACAIHFFGGHTRRLPSVAHSPWSFYPAGAAAL